MLKARTWGFVAVCGAGILAAVPGCSADAGTLDESSTTESAISPADALAGAKAGPAIAQILPAATIATYKAALPKVAWQGLQDVLDSPSTLWTDKEAMIPSYQDSVGDNAIAPIGARANSRGRGVIVPEGKRLFAEDGKTFSFPFAHTAGTDKSTNLFVVNFMFLPAENGKLQPVVYRTVDNNQAMGGLGLHRWTWTYPKGAMLGEVIFIKDGTTLLPVEIRTRTRYATAWAVNAFRPFPTAAKLTAAIKATRPDWTAKPGLAAVVQHIEGGAALTPRNMTSPAWNNVFTAEGTVDELPDLGDPALVRELLTTTKFVSAYGTTWREAGGRETYAASTRATLSIVPNQYEAGLLRVDEKTCTGCHKDAGRSINDFEPQAILYGDVWGSDQIFSFHPWDQTRFSNFNNENRRVRPELTSIVERFDAAKHPAASYQALAP